MLNNKNTEKVLGALRAERFPWALFPVNLARKGSAREQQGMARALQRASLSCQMALHWTQTLPAPLTGTRLCLCISPSLHYSFNSVQPEGEGKTKLHVFKLCHFCLSIYTQHSLTEYKLSHALWRTLAKLRPVNVYKEILTRNPGPDTVPF